MTSPARITVGGQLVKALVEGSPPIITDRIDARSTFSFSFDDEPGARVPVAQGTPVLVEEWTDPTWTPIFGGICEIPSEILYSSGRRRWLCQAVDYHYLASKRLVTASYDGPVAPDDIVRDLVDDSLSASGGPLGEEGISYTGPSLGTFADIPGAIFGYVPVSTALDRLAELAGAKWWIDVSKVIHFKKLSDLASISPVEWADLREGAQVDHGNREYRNVQFVKGGSGKTATQTESFAGDGTRQTFSVAYELAEVPTITLNAGAQTVGIRGVDTGKDWYWNKGDNEISQDLGGTPISSSDTLAVQYVGQFRIVAKSEDSSEIDRRAALEGAGSGQIEASTDDPGVDSREAGFTAAAGKLMRYALEGAILTFRTDRTDFYVGGTVELDLPASGLYTEAHELDGEDFLVSQCVLTIRDDRIVRDVSLVQGPAEIQWSSLFARLHDKADIFVLREGVSEAEILALLEQVSESWSWGETITPSVNTCDFPSPSLDPSASIYPC